MKFILLVYNDRELLGQMSQEQFDADMRDCFTHADELAATGTLLESQQLEDPGTARTVRVRNGRRTIVDGPFAESKEMLGGFNIIEAESMEEALRLAGEFPWVRSGSVEVRPVRDIQAVRTRVAIDAAVASPSKR